MDEHIHYLTKLIKDKGLEQDFLDIAAKEQEQQQKYNDTNVQQEDNDLSEEENSEIVSGFRVSNKDGDKDKNKQAKPTIQKNSNSEKVTTVSTEKEFSNGEVKHHVDGLSNGVADSTNNESDEENSEVEKVNQKEESRSSSEEKEDIIVDEETPDTSSQDEK